MEHSWVTLIEMGIGCFVFAIALSASLDTTAISQVINSSVSRTQQQQAILQEYREVGQYDGKENLRAGDVIQFILKSQGSPAVRVVTPSSTYVFNDVTSEDMYTVTYLSQIISNSNCYKCHFSEGEQTSNGDGTYTYRDYYVFTVM